MSSYTFFSSVSTYRSISAVAFAKYPLFIFTVLTPSAFFASAARTLSFGIKTALVNTPKAIPFFRNLEYINCPPTIFFLIVTKMLNMLHWYYINVTSYCQPCILCFYCEFYFLY